MALEGRDVRQGVVVPGLHEILTLGPHLQDLGWEAAFDAGWPHLGAMLVERGDLLTGHRAGVNDDRDHVQRVSHPRAVPKGVGNLLAGFLHDFGGIARRLRSEAS